MSNIFMTMGEVLVNVVEITCGNHCDTMKIVLCKYYLCKRPFQSVETGGRVRKQVHSPGDDYGFARAVTGHLPLGNSKYCPYLWRKGNGSYANE